MIISTNRDPSLKEFEELCNEMCMLMNQKAQKDPEYYQLFSYRKMVREEVMETGEEILTETWKTSMLEDRMRKWKELVLAHAKKEKFDVSGLIGDIFEDN